ncbi:MAG: LemA family protein [Desulfobacula sp.]|uniref:LemA family protein n=1 Tax=Desulfobacula sp. TaxID=2593537 RepID=UPI0025B7D987|nr:LemA family protein [Desulfobacula sp.]MCD4719302.1 LemA family protein [Desulfobacula sp.]
MPHRWLQFAGFCFVFFGIILFCIILGGYTSFWRSQNRIEDSKSILTDACQKRLDLLAGLIEMAKKNETQTYKPMISQTAQKANRILQQVISQKTPLERNLIKEFEVSQLKLTFQLKALSTQLKESLDKNYSKQFAALRNQFNTAQDNLFVARQGYNDEVNYFNTRTTAFPAFLFAKLFGFDEMEYIEISKDLFLPARKIFTPTTS